MNERMPGVEQILKDGLGKLGLPSSGGTIELFMTYLSELKKWGKVHNLTALREDEDIVTKHFLDSLLYLKALPFDPGPGFRVADIGSGAGFPGIPLKIVRPGIVLFLIEPSQKKCAFLRHIVTRIHLNDVEIIEKRVEETKVGRELAAPVDVAVTRALFSVRDFIKNASHILKPEGLLVLNKGPKAAEELQKVERDRYELVAAELPLTGIIRNLITVRLRTQSSA